MPQNQAAWLKAKSHRLQVEPAPYPKPGHGELVVKNAAVAVNPVDWKVQVWYLSLVSYIYICVYIPMYVHNVYMGEVGSDENRNQVTTCYSTIFN